MKVLDVCCGSRMMWFDKHNQLGLFGDKRLESHVLCDGRALEVKPVIMYDYKHLPFSDNQFPLVVFDPPHLLRAGKDSWLRKKYGVLPDDWKADLIQGFDECWRVLKPEGTLILKWNESQKKLSEVLSVLPQKPLFGHTTNRHGTTHWMTFFKYEEGHE